MMTWTATCAIASAARLGEGPLWDPDHERLIWVDIVAGEIHAWSAQANETSTTDLGVPVGFVVGRERGGYLAGTATGVIALDEELRPAGVVATPPDLDGGRRVNDGACDPAGRVLLGTVDPAGTRTGTLWSLAADGTFTPLVTDVGMSNGIGFSPDGNWLYYVDTATQGLDRFRYDVASGRATERRQLREIPRETGLPDGLAVDAAGCVWLAIWGACRVWRLAADGDLLGTVSVAASRTTSCAFGGPGRDRLFVTTAREDGVDLDVDRDGDPGAVFAADVGVSGAPVWRAAA